MFRFQCPKCGFGDHEVGLLVAETVFFCVVCLDVVGRLNTHHCWEDEPDQARLREALVAA